MTGRRWHGASGWRSAVGEVLLIVLGIMIAMAAQDWQGRRVARQTEGAALREIRTALVEDLELLDGLLARHETVATRVESLLSGMRSGTTYSDSLDAYFGAVYGFYPLQLNRAAYESLKSRGLDLISNDPLRAQIAGVYERVYPRALGAADLEREVVLELLRPYFLAHFRDLRFHISATPIDYSEVIRNPMFLNLVDYRLQALRQNHIPFVRQAATEIRALVESISADLDGP